MNGFSYFLPPLYVRKARSRRRSAKSTTPSSKVAAGILHPGADFEYLRVLSSGMKDAAAWPSGKMVKFKDRVVKLASSLQPSSSQPSLAPPSSAHGFHIGRVTKIGDLYKIVGSPYDKDPNKETPNFGNPHIGFSCEGLCPTRHQRRHRPGPGALRRAPRVGCFSSSTSACKHLFV